MSEITRREFLKYSSLFLADLPFFRGNLKDLLFKDYQPLSQSQLDKFIEHVNSDPQPKKDDTYYAAIFANKSAYENFKKKSPTGIDGVINLHIMEMNKMLKPAGFKFLVTWFLVLEDGVAVPASWDETWPERGLKDSDGRDYLDDPKYIPENSAYYSSSNKVDYGLLHEWGHEILHLNDHYNLDRDLRWKNIALPLSLNNAHYSTLVYYAADRPDQSNDLMSGGNGTEIRTFTRLQLARRKRQGFVHNFKRELWDYEGWPIEFPEKVQMKFYDGTKPLAVSKLEVYSVYTSPDKKITFLSKSPYVCTPENFIPRKAFSPHGNYILDGEAVLLLVIRDKEGKPYLRWMDIRDFNIPYWQGSTDNVTMRLQAMSLNKNYDDSTSFKWDIRDINYEKEVL